MQIVPEMISTTAITMAVTGLFMNVLAIILERVGFYHRRAGYHCPDPVHSDRVIFLFHIPVRDRCPVALLFSLSPSTDRGVPSGIPVFSCHRLRGCSGQRAR